MRRQFVLFRVRVARIWRRPIPDEPPALKKPGRFAISFVACWLIAIAFPLVDLFQLEPGSRNSSREIYNLVMGTVPPQSFLFPRASPPPKQDLAKVTVVLVDETTLDILKVEGRAWPASARFYHQALLSIWRYKPSAVFVDVMFIDQLPGSFELFSDVVKLYEQKGIPLLIVEPTYKPGQRPRQDFKTSNLPAQFAEIHKDDQPRLFKRTTPAVDELIRKHEMVEPVAALASVDVGILRAYGLYGLNADGVEVEAAAVRLYKLATEQPLDRHGPPLEIFWNLRLPETNARWMDCVKPSRFDHEPFNPFEPFARAAQALWNPSGLKQTCGTVPTVPLADLLLPDTDPDSKRMIENNIVLFGTDIIGGDVYTVPVSDQLPGVYVHAMALENLLAFGKNYIRTNLKIGSFTINDRRIRWLFEAPLVAFMVSLFALSRRGREQPDDASMWDKVLTAVVSDAKLGLLTCAVGFGLSIMLLSTLSLAPLNWLGMGALAVLTNEIRKWSKIEARVLAALQTPVESAAGHAAPEAAVGKAADKEPI